jgi:hypothetical protein
MLSSDKSINLNQLGGRNTKAIVHERFDSFSTGSPTLS